MQQSDFHPVLFPQQRKRIDTCGVMLELWKNKEKMLFLLIFVISVLSSQIAMQYVNIIQ